MFFGGCACGPARKAFSTWMKMVVNTLPLQDDDDEQATTVHGVLHLQAPHDGGAAVRIPGELDRQLQGERHEGDGRDPDYGHHHVEQGRAVGPDCEDVACQSCYPNIVGAKADQPRLGTTTRRREQARRSSRRWSGVP